MNTMQGPSVADSFDGLVSADLEGMDLVQVSASLFQVILTLQGDGSPPLNSSISVESSVTLQLVDGTNSKPESEQSMVEVAQAVLSLLGKRVAGHGFDGRDLELRFESGETLTINGEDMPYESYQVTHRGAMYVVGPLPA